MLPTLSFGKDTPMLGLNGVRYGWVVVGLYGWGYVEVVAVGRGKKEWVGVGMFRGRWR